MPDPERLVVFTALYPAALPFLPDLLRGLMHQTDQEFELVLALDGVEPHRVRRTLSGVSAELAAHARLLAYPSAADPIGTRLAALRDALPGTFGVVLLDSDDIPLPTRVAAARAQLRNADLTACALSLADEDGRPLGATFGARANERWDDLLPRSNVFGFGNSAYRSSTLLDALPEESGVRLLDWLVALRAVNAGARVGFDETPRVLYRRHAGSLAVVTRPFSEDQLIRGAALAAAHHEFALRPYAARHRLRGTLANGVEAAAAELARFVTTVVNQPDERRKYVSELNGDGRVYRWWEWLNPRRERAKC